MRAPPSSAIVSVPMSRVESRLSLLSEDRLAVEEPMEIRLDFVKEDRREQRSLSITMRTPANDFELAAGFLVSEGLVENSEDILEIRHCGPPAPGRSESNVTRVVLAEDVSLDWSKLERHFYTTSSCGVCGKSSLAALRARHPEKYRAAAGEVGPRVRKDVVHSLPFALRQAQDIFSSTGGLHASGLFTIDGELRILREDVGRHNALDKVIGWAFRSGTWPLSDSILMLSGRVSFELVQKAAAAGIRIVAAVGAPSSLAVELAKEMNMTLFGFVRDGRFNVYCGEERLA